MPRLPAPDPPLDDGVVVLRAWRDEDVPQIVEACRDPEIPRWTAVPRDYTEADARDWLEGRVRGREPSGGMVHLCVADASDESRVLGSVGLIKIEPGDKAEAGYWVAPWARRKGVATRALRLITAWGIEQFELQRVQLTASTQNEASQRVAERAGFTREGVLRAYHDDDGERHDHVMFSALPGELQPQPSSKGQTLT